MILHIPSEAKAKATSSTTSGTAAPVISLSAFRAERRAKMEEALIDEIIASVQHIDIVRLFELAADREAKKLMAQT
ncbi:hypothetical protein [Roseateles sp.]|uniref:hypothetical protein n=1 Tax=Roseateles sp. TaxID=1971397 RepID=UPI002F428BB4